MRARIRRRTPATSPVLVTITAPSASLTSIVNRASIAPPDAIDSVSVYPSVRHDRPGPPSGASDPAEDSRIERARCTPASAAAIATAPR
jgi:hypothetical protein